MRAFATWVGRGLGAVLTLALAAVIVLGLFGLGYSGGVGEHYADVQDPDAPRTFDLVVSGFDGSTISLESGEGDQLTRPGTWGLEYPGGYGQVGEVVSATGGVTERRFAVVNGEPPVVGTVARLDPAQWRGAPDAVGLTYSDVEYTTELGSYPAWLAGPSSDTWVIIVHDRAADRSEGLRLAAAAADAGMRSLLITYRNDREAPRGPQPGYHWGATEWRDLEGAVRYAADNGAARVVPAGYGMGGSIVLSFLEHSDLADTAVGAILDSPVITLAETVRHDLAQDELGAVFELPTAIIESARLVAGWRFGIDWSEVDYGDTPAPIPMLIFHGDADLVTPLSESQAYASLAPAWVRLRVAPGAGFTEAWNVDPDGYRDAVVGFLSTL